MQFIIGAILVIILIVIVIYAIIFALMVLAVAVPASGAGLAVMWLTQVIWRKTYESRIRDHLVDGRLQPSLVISTALGVVSGFVIGLITMAIINDLDPASDLSGLEMTVSIIGFILATGFFAYGGYHLNKNHSTAFGILEKTWRAYWDEYAPQTAAQQMAESPNGSNGTTVRARTRTMNGLLCPYCVELGYIEAIRNNERKWDYNCLSCSAAVPREYVDNRRIRSHVVSSVGLSEHGKTVFLASVYYSLNSLPYVWSDFYAQPIGESSLDLLIGHSQSMESGDLLFPATESSRMPAVVRFSKLPGLDDQLLLFYDSQDGAFNSVNSMVEETRFVKHSKTVLCMVSLDDVWNDTPAIHQMLSTYTQGLSQLGGSTKSQHLVVVLTKGDRLQPKLSNHPQIWQYLREGSIDALKGTRLDKYTGEMRQISGQLRDFMRSEVKAGQFINFADDRFKSVEYSIISSLGSEPSAKNRMQEKIAPKRVMDPILWIINKS